MSQPNKPEEIAAGSSEPMDLLSDEAPDEMDTHQVTHTALRAGEPPWQFLKQGYDWTGGSLRTKGYRTDFDSVRELAVPSRAPSQQAATSPVGKLDWRHPEHLGAVAEFVSSLTPPATSAPTLPILKPIKRAQRTGWHLLGLGLAAGCLLALASFSLRDRDEADTQPPPLAVAAVSPSAVPTPAEPTPGDSSPSDAPSPSLPGLLSEGAGALAEVAQATGAAEAVVASSDRARSSPATVTKARIELETRDILVSGRAVAAVVILKRTGSKLGPVRVRWKTVPESATPGTDYESVSAIVKFADGQSVRTLFVPILQPPSRAEPRTFAIQLQRLNNGPALGSIKSTTVTIWGDT